MYSKILIPVDGREGAWRAIRVATQASKNLPQSFSPAAAKGPSTT